MVSSTRTEDTLPLHPPYGGIPSSSHILDPILPSDFLSEYFPTEVFQSLPPSQVNTDFYIPSVDTMPTMDHDVCQSVFENPHSDILFSCTESSNPSYIFSSEYVDDNQLSSRYLLNDATNEDSYSFQSTSKEQISYISMQTLLPDAVPVPPKSLFQNSNCGTRSGLERNEDRFNHIEQAMESRIFTADNSTAQLENSIEQKRAITQVDSISKEGSVSPCRGISKSGNTMRKPKTYSAPVASRFCHICSRMPRKGQGSVTCRRMAEGLCRKIVCEQCMIEQGWDFLGMKQDEDKWLCPHCQGSCPPRSQCHIYRRVNARRKRRTSHDNTSEGMHQTFNVPKISEPLVVLGQNGADMFLSSNRVPHPYIPDVRYSHEISSTNVLQQPPNFTLGPRQLRTSVSETQISV